MVLPKIKTLWSFNRLHVLSNLYELLSSVERMIFQRMLATKQFIVAIDIHRRKGKISKGKIFNFGVNYPFKIYFVCFLSTCESQIVPNLKTDQCMKIKQKI